MVDFVTTGDVTNISGSLAMTIAANVVTNAKAAPMPAMTFKGNNTAGSANPTDLTPLLAKAALAITTSDISGVLQAAQMPAISGDVVIAAGTLIATIQPLSVTTADIALLAVDTNQIAAGAINQSKLAVLSVVNGKLAQMPAMTFKANNTAAAASPTDLTAALTKLALAIAVADVSGLGTLATQNGTLASQPTASTIVLRDANANAQINNMRQGFSATPTAGASTALTVASTYLQFFTGTLAQTVVLPDVTTLVQGQQFYIRNNSTGLVTVNSSGGNLIRVIGPGTRCVVTCLQLTGTTAASWSAMYLGINIADGKVLAVNGNLTLSGTDGNALTINSVSASISGSNTGDQDIQAAAMIAVDNAQSGTAYTLALADQYKEISLTSATNCAVSIPLNATVAFAIGTRIAIWADAAGSYSIVGVAGITLNGISGGSRTGAMTVNLSGVRNGVVLRKLATDTWTVSGAIGAVA